MLFKLNCEIKRSQNKVSQQKFETKMPRKKLLKAHLWKYNATKMHFVCFTFLKLSKLEMFFSEARLYIWMKGKRDLATSSNSNGECYEKNSSETRRSMIETGKFYIKNTPVTQPRSFFFLAGSSLWLLLGTSSSSFFLYHFFFNFETKLKQQILQNTEENLLYCTNCHTNA